MTTPIEILMENQKKMVDMWSKTAENMNTLWQKEEKKTAKQPVDFFKDYFEKQQKLFNEQIEFGDPVKAMEKAPRTFEKWMDMQKEFAEQWMDMTREVTKDMHKSNGKKALSDWMDMQLETMKEWNNSSQEMMDKMSEDLLPDNMKPYFRNFRDSYKILYSNWNMFSKMIENGIHGKEWMNKFFGDEAYKSFIDKMMGFHLDTDPNEMLEQVNKTFESYIQWASEWMPGSKEMNAYWKDFQKNAMNGEKSAIFDYNMNFLQQLREASMPFYEMMDESKSAKMVENARDLQFATMAYIIKNAELRQMAYDAGRTALPDTIKHFSEEWKKEQKLPDFNTFYNAFINRLENDLIELMKSDDYSKLQSEVVNSGMKMRKNIDQIMEHQMEPYPVVTRSAYDDLAKEAAQMKRKIRTLEGKIRKIEENLPKEKKKSTSTNGKASAKKSS